MKTLTILFSMVLSQAVAAADVRTVESPKHRVAMLELYTSEGCSSCPPADRWLSGLRRSGISENRLVPMAFHVTYWDYIGWKDSYAMESYDDRQRLLGRANRLSTIYTPQFVLDGKDFRRYRQFAEEVKAINNKAATVDLSLSLQRQQENQFQVKLNADTTREKTADVALFIVVLESGLVTSVEDGENEGEILKHDYVVRQLHGPHFVSRPNKMGTVTHALHPERDWKQRDMDVVGFAQNLHTGEVLQAVSMPLQERSGLSSRTEQREREGS